MKIGSSNVLRYLFGWIAVLVGIIIYPASSFAMIGCGDGFCDWGFEDEFICPEDCGPPPSWCGDGFCDWGSEDEFICPEDCGPPPTWCGDGMCNGAESTTDCPTDCGSVCGDGVCNGAENTTNCTADCGTSCGDGVANGDEACDDDNTNDSDGCSATCTVENGYTCAGTSPSVCSDIDECTVETDNCDANATCTNTAGSFTCECNSGYSGDGVSCSDIDECSVETDNCDSNATCSNTAGGFTCECNAGYSGDGVICSDIDECSNETDNCDANATCTNIAGGFTCECNSGYSGDGVSCSDIDECTVETDNCDSNATCTNIAGGFTCECNAGYSGDGVSCSDVNECSEETDNCDPNAICTNTVGSFTCECNAGFWGNGLACIACGVGTSNPLQGQTSVNACQPCEAGTYNNITAQASCKDCLAGTFNNDTGNYSCEQCPAGYFSAENKAIECSMCEAGSFNGDTGQSSCTPCDEGFESDAGALSCTPICGDGLRVAGEGCDDNDTESGDGCSETCTLEAGYVCPRPGEDCVVACYGIAFDDEDACRDHGECIGPDECECDSGWIGRECEVEDRDDDGVADEEDPCPDSADNDADEDGYCAGERFNEPKTGANDCDDNPEECGANCYPEAPEICDSYDNDCNESTDEDYEDLGNNCSVGVGACEVSATMICTADHTGTECGASPGAATGDDTDCNGIDDNCNGSNDENYASLIANCGVGACAATGSTSCVAGDVADSCTPDDPSDELCDGIDSNCNGVSDENEDLGDICEAHASCILENDVPACICDEGYEDAGDTCDPLPCTEQEDWTSCPIVEEADGACFHGQCEEIVSGDGCFDATEIFVDDQYTGTFEDSHIYSAIESPCVEGESVDGRDIFLFAILDANMEYSLKLSQNDAMSFKVAIMLDCDDSSTCQSVVDIASNDDEIIFSLPSFEAETAVFLHVVEEQAGNTASEFYVLLEEVQSVDGDEVDGDSSDGDMADGDNVDGDNVDGDEVDGDMSDGDADGEWINIEQDGNCNQAGSHFDLIMLMLLIALVFTRRRIRSFTR